MLTTRENETLTRVEGNAPMGQLMRRHWVPALLSEQVAERDGPLSVSSYSAKSWSRSAIATARLACDHRCLE
jgi:phthalate 4,5-dioxygenase oxygenase subunit